MRSPLVRFVLIAGLLLPAVPARAQVIAVKTVPVATGDQFLIFPSDRLGMAGVSLALPDTAGDPFSNPAALNRLDGPQLFGAPTGYTVGEQSGGITLPVGGFFGADRWRGGVALAFQELDRAGEPRVVMPFRPTALTVAPPSPNELGQQSRTNLYGYGAVSRPVGGDGRIAIGASAFFADLTAVEGVDLLYGTRPVDQRGSMQDLRLGLETTGDDGERFDAVVVHRRFAMDHEFQDRVWEPVPEEGVPEEDWQWRSRWSTRTEQDRTNTWGLHVGYVRPLEAEGWRLGSILTANYKSHPKIPNYTLMSIPRDPGNTWAYDLGVGLSKRTESSAFGIDVILEPVWTETWADAATPVPTINGDTIPAGEMTVFNDFRFHNAIIRMGLAGQVERIDLQFGLQLKRYGYTLDQEDLIRDRRRRQQEDWIEWTPSLALALRLDDFTIRYTGRMTAGTGRPGVNRTGVRADAATLASADFLPAPSGALTLDETLVQTHQVSIAIPLNP